MVPSQWYVSVSRRPPDVEDYIDMLRRYRSWILGPTFAGLVISVMTAFFWPDTYISTAVMRITPQQVPERLVPSNVTSQIAERLGAMQTEIISRGSLSDLIQRPSLDLYKRERQRKPMEDVVEQMRRDIHINILDSPSSQPRNRAASAFQISFWYTDRYKAQAVVRELVTKFIEQNITVLRNQASLTTSFLTDELKTAKDELDRIEAEITAFKVQNQGRLPEQQNSNLQALNSLHMQLASVNEAINNSGQQRLLMETQLQNLRNQTTFITSNMHETVGSQAVKNERLIQLNKTILETETSLAAAGEVYRNDHPDIRTFRKKLEVLKKERDMLAAEDRQEQTKASGPQTVINPQAARSLEEIKSNVATLQAQIRAKDLDIEQRIKQQAELNKLIQGFQARIETAPANEQKYLGLLRDQELAKTKFQQMTQKKELSETALNLEERKAGENLEVLDQASLPEQPAEPNRVMIAAAGTGLGLLLGLFMAGMKEMKDTSLKNLKDVRTYTNLPVLSSIPLLENALLVRRKRRLFWLAWSSAIIFGTIAMSGSMYFYYFGRS
ncbi:MAG TPA: GNVR domain-containing protein [Bryobacteraceae bacterium]|nr:GNVR domain-containing protein [Bryobacteraceae bacterium]